MTVIVSSDRLAWPLMQLMKTCVCAAWDDLDPEDQPARCGIVPGRDVVMDDCCQGTVWIRKARTFRTTIDTFPTAFIQQSLLPCEDSLWAVELGVGIVRCAPTPQEDGTPPTVAALEAAALQISDDEERIRQAVLCCFADELERRLKLTQSIDPLLSYGEATSLGPDGDCHGFEVSVFVGLQYCPCP